VPDTARTVAIWVSGLLGSVIVGAMIGSLFFNLFVDPAFLGGFAGLLLFVCFRLWMGEGRALNNLAARITDDEPDESV
jgi:hypothetical protein